MFYIAKVAQASGMVVILISFMRNFPELMSPKILLAGILLFVFGWIVERFMLAK